MEGNALITVGLPISLFIIMVGMGLSLQIADFRRVVEQPQGVALGTVLQLFAIPGLAFAIGSATGGGMMAAGLVLVAALPGGTTSNILCYLARANLALSITLTVLASLLTILTIPLYTNAAIGQFVQSDAGMAESVTLPFAKTLITMLVIVVIPVGLGMLVRHKAAALAQRAEPLIGKFSIFVLLAIIVAIIISEWANLPAWIAAAWLPCLLLNLAALGIGFGSARLLRLPKADALTVAIELGIKNTTLGLTIALSLIGNTELALPAAVYGLLMYASVALLAWYGRRQAPTPAVPS